MNAEHFEPIVILGIIGTATFYGRFVLQWIVSELRQQSVMPPAFWYMSAAGSVLLLAFGVLSHSLLGTLGQNINVVIYGRNISHIWWEKEILTPFRARMLHVLTFTFAGVGLCAVAWLAWREWHTNTDKPLAEAREAWGWLILGLVGQALFAARFILQWIATERAKRSVVPRAFWFLSFFAATFQCIAYYQREELIFATGMAFTVFIYTRNIWFIYVHKAETQIS